MFDPGPFADVLVAAAVRPVGRRRSTMGVRMNWKGHLVESVIGLVIALLLMWVAIAAVTDVPFVYQGL